MCISDTTVLLKRLHDNAFLLALLTKTKFGSLFSVALWKLQFKNQNNILHLSNHSYKKYIPAFFHVSIFATDSNFLTSPS